MGASRGASLEYAKELRCHRNGPIQIQVVVLVHISAHLQFKIQRLEMGIDGDAGQVRGRNRDRSVISRDGGGSTILPLIGELAYLPGNPCDLC